MPPVAKQPRERNKTFLREWRKYRELSQEEVAEKLEIDRTTISRVERGETPYDQDILERLALIYLCDPEDLLSINPMKPDQPRLVYSKLRAASPDMQRRAAEIIDALLKAG